MQPEVDIMYEQVTLPCGYSIEGKKKVFVKEGETFSFYCPPTSRGVELICTEEDTFKDGRQSLSMLPDSQIKLRYYQGVWHIAPQEQTLGEAFASLDQELTDRLRKRFWQANLRHTNIPWDACPDSDPSTFLCLIEDVLSLKRWVTLRKMEVHWCSSGPVDSLFEAPASASLLLRFRDGFQGTRYIAFCPKQANP